MSSRLRVKLDLGPHGKVIASVIGFDDAKAVAASRFNVDSGNVQLYVSDGEDLWELHPSAFQDVVAENGIIVAKALSALPPAPRQPPSASSSQPPIAPKQDGPQAMPLASSPVLAITSLPPARGAISGASQAASSSRTLRSRSSSTTSSASTESSSSTSSSSSSGSSSSSSSSSSSNEGRRSASVQDVTAINAAVRTIMGPNGLPVSSKERWDPKTHRLMFEKLNDIISSETIYYTRKYTEERYRIFQLLIDQYGDMGVKGNFLRGRTAAALISRVAGVLRTARERGEKIKQPFKFFFPNKKDDEVVPRSATAPSTSSNAGPSRAPAQAMGNGNRSQTLPAQANGQARKRKSKTARAAAAAASAMAPPTVPAAPSGSQIMTDGAQLTGNGRGKGKGQSNTQIKPAAQRTVPGQANPPQIRKRAPNVAAIPRRPPSPARAAKRPANGNATTNSPPQKQKATTQPAGQHHSTVNQRQSASANVTGGRDASVGRDPSRRAASSSRRSRSASPGPRDDHHAQERYPQSSRSDRLRDRSPIRMRDSWIRARDASPDRDSDGGRENGGAFRRARRPTVSLPRRPSWTDAPDQRETLDSRPDTLDSALFRAETRSPPPTEQPSTSRSNSNRWRGQASPRPPATAPDSPRTRRNAVERALEHLVSAGADVESLPGNRNGNGGKNRRWGSPHRTWRRENGDANDAARDSPDLRRSVARNQHQQQNGRGRRSDAADNGWPSSLHHSGHGSPRTPPRAD
ncbi:hypothetical protein PSEUBRA_001110 [Kalmanozyma brasiliensis GHG001]|uniref:uncharacterized protein n=1 Tax=Kalmanozyma brasiliensis (strain GHG001) TaxID=1365824 RepID=UPI002867C3B9|nr:uncharacterized protein PSEUBRA_001110 [Kalmanozyma brasiliensis GHG001]EST09161.2 hypothetical protein PSEUBRA_001110 [Kalmanozyma brasiliensis GHG001]